VAQGEGDESLSDSGARAVAGYWYDERDPTSPLSLLARDGRITATAADAVLADVRSLEAAGGGQPSVAQRQLRMLLRYVREHGPRGPLPDWGDLPELHAPAPPPPPPPARPPVAPPPRAPLGPRREPHRRPAPDDWYPSTPSRPEHSLLEEGGSALDLDFDASWDRRR